MPGGLIEHDINPYLFIGGLQRGFLGTSVFALFFCQCRAANRH